MLRLIDDTPQILAAVHPVDCNDLPGSIPALGDDDVHVWHAALDEHPAGSLMPLLADDEIARANRFHFAADRDHFITARGLLRKLLGAYAGVAAGELRFSYAEKGKPALLGGQGRVLSFNLAHSHARAIFAFSKARELGVDIEFIRDDFEGDQIAERFFSASEIATLGAIPLELKRQAFFDCWTRKEAYLKARGDGLWLPLDKFDVAFAPGEQPALLRNHQEPGEVGRWKMQSIPAPEGYVAALVVEGQDFVVKTFRV